MLYSICRQNNLIQLFFNSYNVELAVPENGKEAQDKEVYDEP